MEIESVLVLAGVVFAYSLISKRLEGTVISGPMVFVFAGVVLGATGLLDDEVTTGSVVQLFAEVTLAVLLFTDAVRIDLRVLRRQAVLPVRLLGIGFPLTVLAGGGLALLLFDSLVWPEAFLVAAVLAPTDAALGQAVVTNPRVPVRIRQAINVESGLNDGIAVPVVTLFLSLAVASVSLEGDRFGVMFAAEQIGYGALVGAVIGMAGGSALDRFASRGWVEGAFRQLATLAVAAAAFSVAHLVGGNGFVAAFVAGLAFGWVAREHCGGAADFAEDEGVLLSVITFVLFGAGLVIDAIPRLDWRIALYAVGSLTAVRMVPVFIALVGAPLAMPTKAYLGWFGPRGLASILFALVVVESAETPETDLILAVVVWTVVFSVVLHGVSASPLSDRYADWFESHRHPKMAESEPVDEMRMRV